MPLNLGKNPHDFLTVSAIALACFLSARFADSLLGFGVMASPVWPPAGIALASLVLFGHRQWVGVTAGMLLFDLTLDVPWFVAGIMASGQTLGTITGAWLLRRMQFQPSLTRLQDALGFIFQGVVLSPIVNATISTINAGLTGIVDWQQSGIHWSTIWLGDGMGILTIAPVLFTWLGDRPCQQTMGQSPRHQWRSRLRKYSIYGEMLIWAISLLGVSWFVFHSSSPKVADYPLEYLPFPFLIWAALRFGQRSTVLGGLIVSGSAILGAVQGRGPFLSAEGNPREAIVLLQTFVGIITATALVLAAAVTERQQVEYKLRQKEKYLRGIFEGAGIGIGLDDLNGRIFESNPVLQTMLGYSREELEQLTFADFTHPEDLAKDTELFQEMIAGQRNTYQLEKRHIRKDGEVIWVRLTNSLVRDEAGNPRFTIGVVENISDRKQAEAALQQSEARFRVIAETAACAVLVYQGSRLRYANPAAEQITEYSRDELLAIDFWNLAHPEYRELVKGRGLARQRGEAVPSRYEIKILTKSGLERWVDFAAGVGSFEGQPAGIATAYDITDRKLAEAKLVITANRERLLSEMASRIRSSLDIETILQTTVEEVRQFLKADRVFIGCFGDCGSCRAVAESVAPEWAPVLGWQISDHHVDAIKALFQSSRLRVINDTSQIQKTPFLAEYYQRCQVRAGMGISLYLDGQMFGVLIANQCSGPREWQPFEIELLEQLATGVEIAIKQGRLYRQKQILAADLERQVEQRTAELQQRMEDLQHLNQVKDLLLHAVSHDLRTPVQGMLMVMNQLRSRCCESETVSVPRSILDRMIQSSDDQLQLLNALREEPATDDCKLALACRPFSLHEVLQAALQTVEPLFLQSQVQLINQISADLPRVFANPAQIQQVLERLLTNAVKHNLPGVTIALHTDVIDLDHASDNPSDSFKLIQVTVEDTGVGMTQDQCDRLFKPYVRSLDNPRRTGIGLGLYRCRQIMIAHSGQIGVTSQPGSGSKFWFTLPVAWD
jgi:PAS domain S-box-containing protein